VRIKQKVSAFFYITASGKRLQLLYFIILEKVCLWKSSIRIRDQLNPNSETKVVLRTIAGKTFWEPAIPSCFHRHCKLITENRAHHYLLISLNVVEFCMALTQSCYVTEGFVMVLLPLLRLVYCPWLWPVSTIHIAPPRGCVNVFLQARYTVDSG